MAGASVQFVVRHGWCHAEVYSRLRDDPNLLSGIGPAAFALPGITPVLYNAKQQGVILKNVVTLALIREGIRSPDLPGGTVRYGDVDRKNCGPNVKYIPAMDGDPSMAPLDRVSFGGFEAPRHAGDVWKADFGFNNL